MTQAYAKSSAPKEYRLGTNYGATMVSLKKLLLVEERFCLGVGVSNWQLTTEGLWLARSL
jgi:hypothetical protein